MLDAGYPSWSQISTALLGTHDPADHTWRYEERIAHLDHGVAVQASRVIYDMVIRSPSPLTYIQQIWTNEAEGQHVDEFSSHPEVLRSGRAYEAAVQPQCGGTQPRSQQSRSSNPPHVTDTRAASTRRGRPNQCCPFMTSMFALGASKPSPEQHSKLKQGKY